MKILLPLAAISALFTLSLPAAAERVCVEEAAGVCLKYREVKPEKRSVAPKAPVPARPAAPRAPQTPEAAAEASLQLSRSELRQVQAGLKKAGLYNGPLDGALGAGSRKALSRWQSQSGFAATGYLTFDQVIALEDIARGRQANPTPAVAAPSAPAPAPAAPAPVESAAPASPHPMAGQTYTQVWGKSIAFAVGDMTARLVRLSDDKAEFELEYEPVNQRQFRFRDQCEVPHSGEFTCELRGFEGQLMYISGALPKVTVDGEEISFW